MLVLVLRIKRYVISQLKAIQTKNVNQEQKFVMIIVLMQKHVMQKKIALMLNLGCIPIESNNENCEKKANGECSAKEGKASSFSEYEKCGYVKKDDKDNTYKSQKSYK
jgi:hypothetical protein